MMKKWWIYAVLAVGLPTLAVAQVQKEVEVTKTYVPTLERAEKLSIAPDMTDTMQLRPEIDYTITPLTMQTTLTTRPIRPAQISYWEFNRPRPYYLKAGVGLPMQSQLDLYASTHRPSRGYALGYLNHEGRFAEIENDFGVKNPSTRMYNRVGAAAGRYLRKRLVEGDVNYTHRLYRRYGMHYPAALDRPNDKVGYSNLDAAVRLGDDFQDLTRTNFELRVAGSLLFDHTTPIDGGKKGGENRLSAEARVARMFGVRNFSLGVGYHRMGGKQALNPILQQQIKGSLRYGSTYENLRMEAGLDYCYDQFKGAGRTVENYIFPYLRLEFDLIADAVKPFVELDGDLQGNDYRALSEQNPYLEKPLWLDRSTAEWEGRAGLTGHSKNNRFNYRAYVAYTIRDHARYWLLPTLDLTAPKAYAAGWLVPHLGHQSCFSIGGEVSYRPLTSLVIDASLLFAAYNDDDPFENGLPSMEGRGGVRYEGRKIRCGIQTLLQGERSWSMIDFAGKGSLAERIEGAYHLPFTIDLSADFEYLLRPETALFIEGNNLLCRDLYTLPTMPEYGLSILIGARIAF